MFVVRCVSFVACCLTYVVCRFGEFRCVLFVVCYCLLLFVVC